MNIFNTYLQVARIELYLLFLTTISFCVIVLSGFIGVGGNLMDTLFCLIGLSNVITVGFNLTTILLSLASSCFISAINGCIELITVLILIGTALLVTTIIKGKRGIEYRMEKKQF